MIGFARCDMQALYYRESSNQSNMSKASTEILPWRKAFVTCNRFSQSKKYYAAKPNY